MDTYSAMVKDWQYKLGLLILLGLVFYLFLPSFSYYLERDELIGLVLNIAIMYVLTEYFGLWYIFSRFIAAIIVLGYSYIGHKRITFVKYR